MIETKERILINNFSDRVKELVSLALIKGDSYTINMAVVVSKYSKRDFKTVDEYMEDCIEFFSKDEDNKDKLTIDLTHNYSFTNKERLLKDCSVLVNDVTLTISVKMFSVSVDEVRSSIALNKSKYSKIYDAIKEMCEYGEKSRIVELGDVVTLADLSIGDFYICNVSKYTYKNGKFSQYPKVLIIKNIEDISVLSNECYGIFNLAGLEHSKYFDVGRATTIGLSDKIHRIFTRSILLSSMNKTNKISKYDNMFILTASDDNTDVTKCFIGCIEGANMAFKSQFSSFEMEYEFNECISYDKRKLALCKVIAHTKDTFPIDLNKELPIDKYNMDLNEFSPLMSCHLYDDVYFRIEPSNKFGCSTRVMLLKGKDDDCMFRPMHEFGMYEDRDYHNAIYAEITKMLFEIEDLDTDAISKTIFLSIYNTSKSYEFSIYWLNKRCEKIGVHIGASFAMNFSLDGNEYYRTKTEVCVVLTVMKSDVSKALNSIKSKAIKKLENGIEYATAQVVCSSIEPGILTDCKIKNGDKDIYLTTEMRSLLFCRLKFSYSEKRNGE